jgi:hypothetical protein
MMEVSMAEKCIVIEGRIVQPCEDLDKAAEVGNPPPGKSRGIYEWRLHNTETHKVSRVFFGTKTTNHPKGMAFNFCPWCGERIDAPFVKPARDGGPHA